MLTVTLRGIWAHKLRFMSTIVAIVLGVGFMAGTYVFTDTIGRTFDDLFASVYQHTDTVVRTHKLIDDTGGGADDRREPLPSGVLEQVRLVPSVDRAEPLVRAYAQLIKRNGKPLGGRGGRSFGLGWISDARLNPFRILSGHEPRANNEIGIDKASARVGSFGIGDKVKVLSQSATEAFTIVGVMSFGTADSPAGAGAVAFTPTKASQLFQTNGQVDSILVAAKQGVTQQQVAADIAAKVGQPNRDVLTGKEIIKQTQSDLRKRLKGFTLFLSAFAYLSLFVGMFVISNTFSILVAQRTRELALLRAVGGGRSQLLGSVLGEAAIIGFVASALGLMAGIGLARLLKLGFSLVGFSLPGGTLVVLGRTVIVSFIAGVFITMISALIPAWRAGRVPPLAAIRDVSIDRSASSRSRWWLGLLLAVFDAGLVVKGLSGNGSPLTEGAAFAFAIITVTVLGPVIAKPIARLLGSPLPLMKGIPGALAQKNAVRNPRRTARTALALTIGVSVVAMILLFASSFKGLITKTVDGQFKADYVVTNRAFIGFSPEVAKRISQVPGVKVVSGIRFGSFKLAGSAEFVMAFDTNNVADLVALPIVNGRISDVKRGAIALSDKTAAKKGWKIGDAIPVVLPKGATRLRLAALLDDRKIRSITQGGSAIMSLQTFEDGFTEPLDFQVYVKAAAGSNLDELTTALDKTLKDYPTAEVLDQAEYKRSISDQINSFLVIVFILLGLSVIIAMFGVANTLLLSIHERQREIGLLRAVGMTRMQTRTTVRWESVIMAVLGVVLGLVIGVVFGWFIMRSLRDDGFTEIVVPYPSLVVITFIGAIFGIIAGIRPAFKASNLDMLKAIGFE